MARRRDALYRRLRTLENKVLASAFGSEDMSGFVDLLSRSIGQFQTALVSRVERLAAVPDEAATLAARLREGDASWGWLLAVAVACVLGVLLSRWLVAQVLVGGAWRSGFLASAGTTVLVGLVWILGLGWAMRQGSVWDVARLWTLATTAFLLFATVIRAVVVQHEADRDQRSVANGLSAATGLALLGLAGQATLRRLGAGPGLLDASGLALGVAVTAVLCLGYVGWHRTVERALVPMQDVSRPERRLAASWPWLAAGLVLMTFVVLQLSATLASPLPGVLVLCTVMMLLLAPHLDQAIGRSVASADGTVSVIRAAARRTARPAFWLFVLCCLVTFWISPLSVVIGYPRGLIAARGFNVAVLTLAAVYIWNLVGAVGDRAIGQHSTSPHDEDHQPATRLATLAPIVTMTVQVAVVALAALSVLIALGINAWPFVAGLSVFGLAVGFGSQSLVKDIVSGVFFLLDDAFRLGEYVETSQAKGTVERISIRSVALRHPRGALATVPYGSIGKVVNFSRDWVIDKIAFRVAFDTDPDVVRKLFKKIGQDISADPELGPDLLQPFKSQGVFAVDDGTLVIRAKFMARPGRQFMIRKAVLSAVHRGFRENGIVSVAKAPQFVGP